MPTANEKIQDRQIRHAVYLERLKGHEVRQIASVLEQSRKDLETKLAARLQNIKTRGHDTGPATTKRIQDMLSAVKTHITKAVQVAKDKSLTSMTDLATMEASFQKSVIDSSTPVDIGFIEPSPQTLKAIVKDRPMQGKVLGDWWTDVSKKAEGSAKTSIILGLTQHETVPQIVSRVRQSLQTTTRDATVLTRTAVTHFASQAREITYDENADLLQGIQYVATLDARTTEICASLDGRVYPLNEGPRPPQHMQCRSTTTPVLKSWDQLGLSKKFKDVPASTRASMNGQVAGKQTYPEWLKTQSPFVQREVLGKKNAELFALGKYEIGSKLGQVKPLNLDGVKVKEGLKAPKPKKLKDSVPSLVPKTKKQKPLLVFFTPVKVKPPTPLQKSLLPKVKPVPKLKPPVVKTVVPPVPKPIPVPVPEAKPAPIPAPVAKVVPPAPAPVAKVVPVPPSIGDKPRGKTFAEQGFLALSPEEKKALWENYSGSSYSGRLKLKMAGYSDVVLKLAGLDPELRTVLASDDDYFTNLKAWMDKKQFSSASKVAALTPNRWKESAISWKGTGYKEIRKYQHDSSKVGPQSAKAMLVEHVGLDAADKAIFHADNLDAMLESAVIPKYEATEVYRGVRNIGASLYEKYKTSETVSFTTLQSSSRDITIARGFYRGSKESVLMKIRTKRGVHIADIGAHQTEDEVLLSKNAKFKVVSRTEVKKGELLEIELEEIDG